MARALIKRFGTNTCPDSKRAPMASMALIIYSLMISWGAAPPATASRVTLTACSNLPAKMASYNSLRLFIAFIIYKINNI